ncbi:MULTISPECIES: MarR family winged helix-turn-helix transcriptional regulator [Brevibacillus]|uniref:MarR family winged helix-turn-helix transcriptional regulator n=1 Tax=Brevibacillus TaxID=55080 RepID=UPI00156B8481|nr:MULTISPECIES: MarR family winged helix-turn-helix transcriptional regulator [Brevibacillus]MBU8716101.1 MarR family transcriptional regulator [Brevibacillus parabrevis]MED2253529.1 MarR family winged helix-turn-helix transcriptional regulator [Brevibacillus parabrevis]NRQ56350.1 winged helix-turn-helix transcriptional regulator [Brevibacillus sp. HD1.4A]UED69459.1 MarR family winged helix-turn-helix transcriptional regulator [Brevibacillus sp. HD3.3A]
MNKQSISDIRQFNRFYTKILGLFNDQILETNYTLTEARVLFEISERTECIANNLVQELRIDRSYMSRILRKFEREELIEKKTSLTDSRKTFLSLTQKGKEVLDNIHSQSDEQIEQLLDGLTDRDVNEICEAMALIQEKLSKAKMNSK